MLDKDILREINKTVDALGFDASTIEKNYYVTQVIHAFSGLENGYSGWYFAVGLA